MKKIITFSLIISVVALMSNCSPKVAKKTARSESKTENNTSGSTATNSGNVDDLVKAAQGGRSNDEQVKLLAQATDLRVESGKKLYESTCNKCHDLHSPGKRNADSWVQIMKEMGPKAKIDQSTYMMISAYLVKNAKG